METKDMGLESFIEELLTEKQFEGLEPEVYDQLKEDLMKRAVDVVNAALINQLSKSKMDELEDMLDAGAPAEKMQEFLAANVQDMSQIVAGTLIRFRNSYIGQAA